MPLTQEDWHQRYLEQTRWTGQVRNYLFEKSNMAGANRILDVGCGTGALEMDFLLKSHQLPVGVDIDHTALTLARKNGSSLALVRGDAQELPFKTGVFEISYCHFLLLWVDFPSLVLKEMTRVTRPGGVVMAIAEPDYGGRIDYPVILSQIGHWQVHSLQKQGADPLAGRKLLELFHHSGLIEIETGVISGQWISDQPMDDFESEWKVVKTDIEILNLSTTEMDLVHQLKEQDATARLDDSRVLYVPTFYAWGRVPGTF